MRTAADLLNGRNLAIAYSDMAADIEREAADPKFRSMPLSVRRMRNLAAVARKAAIAERDHPDTPEPPACSICGRTRSCLAVAS